MMCACTQKMDKSALLCIYYINFLKRFAILELFGIFIPQPRTPHLLFDDELRWHGISTQSHSDSSVTIQCAWLRVRFIEGG